VKRRTADDLEIDDLPGPIGVRGRITKNLRESDFF
jgi:hypothetical protein